MMKAGSHDLEGEGSIEEMVGVDPALGSLWMICSHTEPFTSSRNRLTWRSGAQPLHSQQVPKCQSFRTQNMKRLSCCSGHAGFFHLGYRESWSKLDLRIMAKQLSQVQACEQWPVQLPASWRELLSRADCGSRTL